MQDNGRSTWRASPPVMAREDCSMCQGTGWEMLPGPGPARARRCSCRALYRLLELKERIKIPPRYEHCTLDSYGPLNFSQTRALAEARRFAERYPNVERGLIFVGGSGVGKSHLAVGIVQQLLQRFKDDLLFVEFPALLQLQLALAGSGSRLDVDWNRLRRVSLLLLDDFGLVNPTDENVYHAEELLRARMEAGRITIYTGGRLSCRELVRGCSGRDTSATHTFLSALSPEVLVRFLAVNRLVSLVGEDYRKKTASTAALF